MIMVVMAMMRIIGLEHTGGPGPGYNDGDYIVMITMTMVMLMMSKGGSHIIKMEIFNGICH